jgi:hypothetical protein
MTTMWLVELVPAFEEHPPFQTTYYAGYRFVQVRRGRCGHEAVAEQVLCVESKGAYVL